MTGYWAELKATDFHTLPKETIAVLPLGATEQHGPHLPLSVDSILVDAVVKRTFGHLAERQNVLILPTLTITKSNEHSAHPGTLTLSARTTLSVIEDIVASVVRSGVRRLVFLNGHGGNAALLEIAARETRIAHDIVTAVTSWFTFADTTGLDPKLLAKDIHAGLTETAGMLAARSELVDMTAARDFRSALEDWEAAGHQTGLTGQPARPGWTIDDVSETGACGDAASASEELGERLLESAARGFAAYLKDFATFDLVGRKQ